MAKPPWQEPDGFTEHARGTYARTSPVCPQNSWPPYRRLLRRLHIARQKIFKDMLRHIILFSWWRQFTTDCDGINLPSLVFSPPWYLQRIYFCDDGTLNSILVSSSFFSRENLIKSKKKLTKMHNELTKTIHGIELTSWFLGSSDSTTNDALKFPLSSHLYLFFDMRRSR